MGSEEQSSDPWTPGPWETDGYGVGVVGTEWCVGWTSPGTIASLADGEYIENYNKADARLIAASPDMIALIRKMRGAIASLPADALGMVVVPPEADGETGYEYPIRNELIDEANALEAKIMGDGE